MVNMTDDLHTKVEVMTRDIDYIKKDISEIKETLKAHAEEERETWEKYMEKKADRWVQTAFIWVVAGIVAACASLVWAVTIKGL